LAPRRSQPPLPGWIREAPVNRAHKRADATKHHAESPDKIPRPMQILVATVFGLCLWIILWAFDVKAIDGFLLVIAIVLSATVAWMAGPWVRNLLKP
jgi:hypothetical protein